MSFPSSSDLRFSIAGPIASCDQHGRWLRIGVRNFWLSPGISVAGLVQGARVTAIGYQDDETARWVVTHLTHGEAPSGSRADQATHLGYPCRRHPHRPTDGAAEGSMTRSSLLPPDSTCAICSKPIRSGGFTQSEISQGIHLRCRREEPRPSATVPEERDRLIIERATDLAEETRRRFTQPTRHPRQHGRCPVCVGPATLTDWRPQLDWMTVEDCPCGGFFVWTSLVDEGRLARLTREDREILSQRLRHVHAVESEAWITTRDGTRMGALIIRSERPNDSP